MKPAGAIWSGDGFGWCCLVCRALGCRPIDFTDYPAMATVDGLSVCTAHLDRPDLARQGAAMADSESPESEGITRRELAAAEIRLALYTLVLLKDGPRGPEYEVNKGLAWDAARRALNAWQGGT